MKATLKYRGSTLAETVKLAAQVLNSDNSVKNIVSVDVKGTGEFEIETGALDGETVRFTVCDTERCWHSWQEIPAHWKNWMVF